MATSLSVILTIQCHPFSNKVYYNYSYYNNYYYYYYYTAEDKGAWQYLLEVLSFSEPHVYFTCNL